MRKIIVKDLDYIEKTQSFLIGLFIGVLTILSFFVAPFVSADFTESDLPITVTSEMELLSSFDKTAYNVANDVAFTDILITRSITTWYIVNVYYINPDTTYSPFAYIDGANVVINRDEVFYTFDTNGSGSDSTNWDYTFTTSYYSGTSGQTSFAYGTNILYSSFDIYTDSTGSALYYSADGQSSTSIPFNWEADFGWSNDDVTYFYINSPSYTYTSSADTPRFGFDEYETPEVNFAFNTSDCFIPFALEGEEWESCDPYEFTFKLYQDTTLLETFDVTTGESYLSTLGYLRWNYPNASSQSPYTLDFFLTAIPETDTKYTIEVYDDESTEIAGIDFYIGETLDIYSFDYDNAVSYICDDLDGTLLPLDDFCRLIIPEPNYFSNEFSKLYSAFIEKFYFVQQIKELISSSVELFSDDPEIPDDITFTFQGNTYTFISFTYIDSYAYYLRNLTGVIMWGTTVYVIFVVINSLFTFSKEDDLI